MGTYSVSDVQRILLLDRNQRFIWEQYNYSTSSLTSEALGSIQSQAASLRAYEEVFTSEIRSLECLAQALEKRIDDSKLNNVPF